MKTRDRLFGGSWMRDARSDSRMLPYVERNEIKGRSFPGLRSYQKLVVGEHNYGLWVNMDPYYDTSVVGLSFRFEKLT
jgi:hypothetical protein